MGKYGKAFRKGAEKEATKVAEAAGQAAVRLLVVAAIAATPRIVQGVTNTAHRIKTRGKRGMDRLRGIPNKMPRIGRAKDRQSH